LGVFLNFSVLSSNCCQLMENKDNAWDLIAKKLAGEATLQELEELEDLLRKNPGLYYPLQTVADLWMHTSSDDRTQAEEAFSRHLDRMTQQNIDFAPSTEETPITERRSGLLRKALFIVPILAAVSILVWLFSKPARNPAAPLAKEMPIPAAGSEIFTNSGSRTHLTLPDGTLVWLNAGSRIHYEKNFGATIREVQLIGEAFFDVAPNASKPFVIHTRSVDIRVLGTSFNIKSYPTDKTTETTLIKGSIEVSIRNRPSDKIILKPNEKLVVSNEDSSTLKKTAHRKEIRPGSLVVIGKPTYEEHSGAMIETSWVDNKLIFQDQEFGELAKQMERWYGVTIQFEDPKVEELRFTGIFEKETIQQALDALKLTARFDYTIEGSAVTIHN
jgi:transmembrane sensor